MACFPKQPCFLKGIPVLLAGLVAIGPSAHAQQPPKQFPKARESIPELIELYTQSDSGCRLVRNRDVKTVVACLSRSVYGAALNERNWCFGTRDQANAEMEWHECEADSNRFPPLQLPAP